jgi:hypothetical protein
VDYPFGEDRPILTGQAPSLQLVGSGEATSLGITGRELQEERINRRQGFVPLPSRVSLISQAEVLRSLSS